MTWWVWLIIIGVIYYASSWVLLIKYNFGEWEYEGFYLALAFVGLGIVPILHFFIAQLIHLIKYINQKHHDNNISIIHNSNLIDTEGIVKIDNHICFNITNSNYRGQINIDIDNVNYKKMKKIINKLNKWGQEEQLKIATLNAIQSIKSL